MPKIVDSQARREEIAHAVWSIAAREGINAATIRAVAAECDLSVGAIQHSFKSQASLQQFAMEIIVQRISHRLDTFKEIQEKPIRSVVVAALLQLITNVNLKHGFGLRFSMPHSPTKILHPTLLKSIHSSRCFVATVLPALKPLPITLSLIRQMRHL